MPSGAARPLPDLAEVLRSFDDARLASLLHRRPDLATPPPTSITALASRAGSRGSVARAVADLDAPTLATLEAVVLLDRSAPCLPSELERAIGTPVGPIVAHLIDLALLIPVAEAVAAIPAAGEVIGSSPLGLGPGLAELDVDTGAGWPTTTRALTAVTANAPEDARRTLDALTWGPPVGTVSHDIPAGARWLLDAHVLHRRSGTELVLPREVAIAARGGRLVRELALSPPLPEATHRDPDTVAAESVRAAEETQRHLGAVIEAWGRSPARVLRSGGVAVRDLRQLSARAQIASEQVTFAAELAAMLGLIGRMHDDGGSSWAPTPEADLWSASELTVRWAEMAQAWLCWSRVPWLAGTRTDKGALRAALGPDLDRLWAPTLRRRVLATLAAWPRGSAPDPDQVRERLAWYSARAVPPGSAVAAILAEAAALGLTGAGALTAAGRTVLAESGLPGDPERPSVAASAPERTPAHAREATRRIADAFTEALPPTVEDLIVQGDLTGIVPGRPGPALAALLAEAADVESRGAAVTVRFTQASVRRAIEAGTGADELLKRLRAASQAPLPQPLEYLVRDVARTHGQVRVGSARSYLRVHDPATATALLSDPRLGTLGLRSIAPSILVSREDPHVLLEALREAGAAPVLEGEDGSVVTVPSQRVRAARASQLAPVDDSPRPAVEDVVAHMRSGEDRARRLLADRAERAAREPAPAEILEALKLAARAGTEVELVVAGTHGGAQSRIVRPLTVDDGRVRVVDVRRDAEITVAPHRIVSVRPVG
ncbi:helicase-associated domain-containing protein [Ruania halotolerans]|uniref:helicase-associated domain-containing protein n=1 Tax=Ruania halotolerans TaxID=2897773 RepID=UPI001E3F806B|nr:helicase-associated domain-containing protein [Ruania halotolerans]UFU07268.1 helicase-associated domain-containing protein [Ruania halotolerans]